MQMLHLIAVSWACMAVGGITTWMYTVYFILINALHCLLFSSLIAFFFLSSLFFFNEKLNNSYWSVCLFQVLALVEQEYLLQWKPQCVL